LAYTEFLALLIEDEIARREQKKYSTRLRRAAFRTTKTLDAFDFNQLPNVNRALVHELVAERYEKAATIVTSNLDLPEWDQAFPASRLLASATLDRLRHNAYCLVLDGKSYRSPRLGPTTTLGKEEKNDVKKHLIPPLQSCVQNRRS